MCEGSFLPSSFGPHQKHTEFESSLRSYPINPSRFLRRVGLPRLPGVFDSELHALTARKDATALRENLNQNPKRIEDWKYPSFRKIRERMGHSSLLLDQ